MSILFIVTFDPDSLLKVLLFMVVILLALTDFLKDLKYLKIIR